MTAIFDTRASRMKVAIAAMETAVVSKRSEEAESEGRLREKIEDAKTELGRSPLAGSLVWRRRNDG